LSVGESSASEPFLTRPTTAHPHKV